MAMIMLKLQINFDQLKQFNITKKEANASFIFVSAEEFSQHVQG